MSDGSIDIRSYRVVFDLERRIHRIDRFRIPLPYGLPLRSIAYAAGALAAVLLLTRVPAIGQIVAALPVPMRFVALPCVAAYWLTRTRVDGRPAHTAGLCALNYLVRPRRLTSVRAMRGRTALRGSDLRMVAGATGPAIRPGTIRGPARVLIRHPFTARQRGATLSLRVTGEVPKFEGKRIVLEPGQRVVIKCAHR